MSPVQCGQSLSLSLSYVLCCTVIYAEITMDKHVTCTMRAIFVIVALIRIMLYSHICRDNHGQTCHLYNAGNLCHCRSHIYVLCCTVIDAEITMDKHVTCTMRAIFVIVALIRIMLYSHRCRDNHGQTCHLYNAGNLCHCRSHTYYVVQS